MVGTRLQTPLQRVPTIEESTDKSDPLCDGDYCFDEILLRGLKNKLNNITHKSTLIVLHMIGSHGPTYYRRYPNDHKIFMPDCTRSDIQNCSQEALVNTYDNTIAYTDFVLANIMSELNSFGEKNKTKTSMFYISDHGESLGEKGIYFHGLPYAFAPEEQTHVPMLYWTNKKLIKDVESCQNDLLSKSFSHDNISHTLLGKLNIDTTLYQAEKDIFSTCNSRQIYAKNIKPSLNIANTVF
jgi:lipid A ethanolaminephosphotransferase